MIENLKGIYETVNYRENTSLKLYDNDECENYPPHWHTQPEIIMPTENIYTIECCDQTHVLREGDIVIFSPCCIHTLYAPPTGKRIIFQPDTSVLRGLKEIETILSLISPFIIITPEDYPNIHQQLQELLFNIEKEYLKNTALSEASIYSDFLSMLVLIGRNHTQDQKRFDVTNNKQQEYTEKFMYICDYISAHCTENLTLDFVADLAGFSKFHFTRLFKQFTNVSFYKYLNQKRIATAEKLLANPKNSVTDVALNSGFTSLSSFIRMFKLTKGCTPTEFRNMYHIY